MKPGTIWVEDECTRGTEGHETVRQAWERFFKTPFNMPTTRVDHVDCFEYRYEVPANISVWSIYGAWDEIRYTDWTLELTQRCEKLQKFKDFVHNRLDQLGIVKEPNGKHSAQGCRIGDRLDLVKSVIITATRISKWSLRGAPVPAIRELKSVTEKALGMEIEEYT